MTALPTHSNFIVAIGFVREVGDMAGLGKQAKILTEKQVTLALAAVATRRYPIRDRVIIP